LGQEHKKSHPCFSGHIFKLPVARISEKDIGVIQPAKLNPGGCRREQSKKTSPALFWDRLENLEIRLAAARFPASMRSVAHGKRG
jgi:hypothetical protein